MRIALLRTAGLLWLASLLVLDAAASDVRRIEAIGAAPLDVGASSRRAPRDRALRIALSRAVAEVAEEQLAGLLEPPPPEVVALTLGKDPFEYASRFRVLEDRGEQEAEYSEEPGVEREYVLLAEVHVDAARVRERLAEAGLIHAPSGEGAGRPVRIALVDLGGWDEIQAVRQLLRDVGGAHAVPVEVARGRAVLEIETSRSPGNLLRELLRRAPASLRLESLGAGGDEIRVRARVVAPPPEAADSGTFDTPGPERY